MLLKDKAKRKNRFCSLEQVPTTMFELKI